MEESNNLFDQLNAILEKTDLTEITADDSVFSEVPDGYYLCEVEKAEIKETKMKKEPMISFQFVICENGIEIDDNGNFFNLDKTKNRKIFINYVIKDETSLKRFVTDALKFEGDEKGKPILEKEYFVNSELLQDALEILIGLRIYVRSSTVLGKNGVDTHWKNLISWKRIGVLGLPQ